MFKIHKILSLFSKENDGKTFYSFSNADGKTWLMPIRNMQMAMNLYQPSSKKGKLIKYFFPYFHCLKFVRKIIDVKIQSFNLQGEILSLLERLFKQTELEYAVFYGSPGARQKKTIQIYKGKKILGYVKITKRNDIAALFEKETKMLDFLKSKGIKDIPLPLFCGNICGQTIFVQSTYKTKQSKVLHKLTDIHIQYVENFCNKTTCKIKFIETDLYANIQYLISIINTFDSIEKDILQKSINTVINHYLNVENYCCLHGDFTPWNMYVEQGVLCVFDFEYAGYSYPKYMDIIHFILQTSILEKNLVVEDIYVSLERHKNILPIKDKDDLILAYLVHIFSHYMALYDGKFSKNDRSYKIWMGLMKKYNNKI